MKKIFLLLFLFVTIYTIDAQTFSNPISDLADPHIVHHDGFYYCTGTTGWSVGIKKSATLEGLKSAPVYHVYDQGLGGPCCDYWAPEIHRINGNWYIYFTAAESDGGPQYSFVLENMDDDILSVNWVEKGRIYDPENDVWAIDGTVFNLDGINYFVYSAVANASDGDKPQRIYIGELTDPWTMKPGRELLSSPQYSWELNGMVNEAPEVIQRNGKVFIVYSANGCWTTDYLLGMLSLDATDDPMVASNWHKHRDPVFTKNAAVQVYGPGHHCFFTSPDGTEDWFAYHATAVPEGACDNSRTVRAQRLSWDKDGNPFFGIPVATGAKMAAPSGEPPLPAADVIENGIYQIVSKASGKLLDVAGVSQHLGANVHQWEFANVPSQRWIIQALPDGNYTINSCSGGLSMDVAGGSSEDGANIGMWAPNGTDAQMWRIEKNNEGYYSIISKNSNKDIGVEKSSLGFCCLGKF
jgi:GH43 family beta-xylosidase